MTVRDPEVMRALAHPARLAIMEYLGGGNVATATECAQVCGLSPSATSYHLRELAKAGLIEEAPSRGDGRERVWRESSGRVFGVFAAVGNAANLAGYLAGGLLLPVLAPRTIMA